MIDDATSSDLDSLAALLVEAVDGGATMSFRRPLAAADARAFWEKALQGATTLVAREGGIVACVQLRPAWAPNQRHRGDVEKLIVRADARRAGWGRRLMDALEARARAAGLTLLTLHTHAGGPAEAFYRRLGWRMSGIIPGYTAAGDTAFFYKPLAE
jgi:ribosomal protein S18 acetylase RimI-like enzyme